MSLAAEIPAPGACCPAAPAAAALAAGPGGALGLFARAGRDGRHHLDLMVPAAHCATCIGTVEQGLARLPGIAAARLNLSLRRLAVSYDPGRTDPAAIVAALGRLGYEARPFDGTVLQALDRDAEARDLLARLGVAGFAAMNIMLLSVGVWAGAEAATRDLLHWVSALIALPTVAFAGLPFFRSALAAVRARRLNMDVPISVGIWLTAGVSLSETIQSGRHAYFDAAVSLTFFLLLGRLLDHRTRALARSAAAELAALSARSAERIAGGVRTLVRIEDLRPGDIVAVAAGEALPADGRVVRGESALDRSLVTGESRPEPVAPGAEVHAGMLNVAAPIEVEVTATGEATLIAGIARMVAAAEAGRNRYTRLADRAARLYSPTVHLAALLTFLGWTLAGLGGREALMIAAAVLIITCPCALGLAVPAVQAVVGGRLFRRAIFVKDGTALERLASADTVVLDKTGTLTEGRPEVLEMPAAAAARSAALALARLSRHPYARAVAEALEAAGVRPAPVEAIAETPGAGVEGRLDGARLRLGRADWCGVAARGGAEVWLTGAGAPARFRLGDRVKADAAETVAGLRARGLRVLLLSGDAPEAVAEAAAAAGIAEWKGAMTPAEKLAALAGLAAEGHRVAMVGDGLNDAPALAAAHVSLSPATAADIARTAADFVIPPARLAPVLACIDEARLARRRALENFAIATLYNLVAIPVAVAGWVTPLVAALAMSGSSVLVTLNALRPGARGRGSPA